MVSEKLIQAHEKVKNHRFRVSRDPHYAKSYGKALYDLEAEFTAAIKKTEYEECKGVWYFFHEFLSNVFHFNTGDETYLRFYKDGKEMDKDIMIMTDCCIGDIHRFIETGTFVQYHTYYTGCNRGPKGERKSRYELNEKTKTFERVKSW